MCINFKVRFVLILIMVLTLISCVRAVQKPIIPSDDIRSYIDAVRDAYTAEHEAAIIGHEWRDTRQMLDAANKVAETGDFATASKLVEEVKVQYLMAMMQGASNESELKNTPYYNPKASPKQDQRNMQKYFRKKFPKLKNTDFANGFYALDKEMRANWDSIEEFPPYSPAVDEGKQLWNTPFKNNKTYNRCFKRAGVVQNYPKWDRKAREVVTLPIAINKCREKNGEEPLIYGSHEMLALQAYMAFKSRGKKTRVVIPRKDRRAVNAYKQGKKFYFARRGQLNLACYHCHFINAGKKLRGNTLSPALGQTTHWPAYRSKWGGMGSLHRRYKGCNKQVRAKAYDLQSEEYRNLEFFHTYMSNGIRVNGPGSRY